MVQGGWRGQGEDRGSGQREAGGRSSQSASGLAQLRHCSTPRAGCTWARVWPEGIWGPLYVSCFQANKTPGGSSTEESRSPSEPGVWKLPSPVTPQNMPVPPA